jgi:hypothetical protein
LLDAIKMSFNDTPQMYCRREQSPECGEPLKRAKATQ